MSKRFIKQNVIFKQIQSDIANRQLSLLNIEPISVFLSLNIDIYPDETDKNGQSLQDRYFLKRIYT